MNPFTNPFFRLCFELYQIYQFSIQLHNFLGVYPLFCSPFHKKILLTHFIFLLLIMFLIFGFLYFLDIQIDLIYQKYLIIPFSMTIIHMLNIYLYWKHYGFLIKP
jgi:hypothetical protein